MKNFWLERAEKKTVDKTIENIFNNYVLYTMNYTVTMDTCETSSSYTIVVDTGISQFSTNYAPVVGTVIASIDDGFPRYIYDDATFQKEVERIEAEGWILDV